MMTDEVHLIHATARRGEVVVEPLAEVAARNPVIGRRRL
jgi:hypothetical protein